jgi:hypothetical protein
MGKTKKQNTELERAEFHDMVTADPPAAAEKLLS